MHPAIPGSAPVRVALVTGAARGLGLAIAQRLARDGLHCVLVDRLDEVVAAAAALGSPLGHAEGHVLDLTDGPALDAWLAGLAGRLGRVDVLVNNAGIHPKHPNGRYFLFKEISRADWRRVFAINLDAAFTLCQAVLPLMRAQGGGRIVNIASRAGRMYSASAGAHYAASKAALVAMTRSIAGEHGREGITANCVAPGATVSPMSRESGATTGRYLDSVPVGRIGTAEELAATVAFLAGPEAGYINGAIVDFNGGSFMP